MSLDETQNKRYSRHLALAEVGVDGQETLLDSSVLIIGAGGLGNIVAAYLTAAGVGNIGIADSDVVDLSNLQRQILYRYEDIGRQKVTIAKDALEALNGDVKVKAYPYFATAETLPELIKEYDIVADCSDNFDTRFLVADTCALNKKTLVSAAVHEFEGQLSTFKPYLGEGHPSYRCFCPENPNKEEFMRCSQGGILGSVVGVMGSLQATEVIKEILELGDSLSGLLLRYYAKTTQFHRSIIKRSDRATL
jgi:adenylyltransferase/sulfurtransferase